MVSDEVNQKKLTEMDQRHTSYRIINFFWISIIDWEGYAANAIDGSWVMFVCFNCVTQCSYIMCTYYYIAVIWFICTTWLCHTTKLPANVTVRQCSWQITMCCVANSSQSLFIRNLSIVFSLCWCSECLKCILLLIVINVLE